MWYSCEKTPSYVLLWHSTWYKSRERAREREREQERERERASEREMILSRKVRQDHLHSRVQVTGVEQVTGHLVLDTNSLRPHVLVA